MKKLLLIYFISIFGGTSIAQTTFSGLGTIDSGGAGFKTISNINTLVVSNNMDHSATEIYGSMNRGGTEVLTLKADGTNAELFDLDDIMISNFTGSSTYAGTTLELKYFSGGSITMSGTTPLTTTPISISAFFTTNNTIPISGVSEIIFTVVSITSPSNFIIESITHSNPTLDINSYNTEFNNLLIYPNPSQGLINLNFGDLKNVDLKVFNSIGQLVYQKEDIINTYQFELNKPTGIYYIQINSQGKQQQYKLIKK